MNYHLTDLITQISQPPFVSLVFRLEKKPNDQINSLNSEPDVHLDAVGERDELVQGGHLPVEVLEVGPLAPAVGLQQQTEPYHQVGTRDL